VQDAHRQRGHKGGALKYGNEDAGGGHFAPFGLASLAAASGPGPSAAAASRQVCPIAAVC